MSVASLLDSRLVMVTGKGGTGKTTYAAALAVLGAAKGRRTLLCEIDNQRPSMSAIFGTVPGYEPREVRPKLWISNIKFSEALGAFVHKLVPAGRVVKLVLDNKIVSRFLDFTPGSRELVTMSRLGSLVEEYDLVVVDMPASGHAFSLLDILRSAMGLFRSGPVRALATELRKVIQDPRTAMVFVAIPEEMVVNETLETYERMKTSELLGGAPAIFLNRATLPSLTADERELIGRLSKMELSPLQAEFVRAGRWEDELEQATATSRDRLVEAFPTAPVLVPPSGAGGVPRHVVAGVAVSLGRHVGITRRDLPWI
jgi:Mrp family chromosome partitioning ATPase